METSPLPGKTAPTGIKQSWWRSRLKSSSGDFYFMCCQKVSGKSVISAFYRHDIKRKISGLFGNLWEKDRANSLFRKKRLWRKWCSGWPGRISLVVRHAEKDAWFRWLLFFRNFTNILFHAEKKRCAIHHKRFSQKLNALVLKWYAIITGEVRLKNLIVTKNEQDATTLDCQRGKMYFVNPLKNYLLLINLQYIQKFPCLFRKTTILNP